MKDIKDYLHLYLNQQVEVQKKDDPGNKLIGRICEVTCGSNHGDWIKVWFDTCVEVYTSEWGKSFSNTHTFFINYDHIRLLLRPLSDMTEEEALEFLRLDSITRGFIAVRKGGIQHTQTTWEFNPHGGGMPANPHQFVFLLSKGFDLFGLIEAGLAIDKTKEAARLRDLMNKA